MRGVYDGQSGRQAARPGAELLSRLTGTISVSVIEVSGQVCVLLTPPTEVRRRFLELRYLPPDS